MATDNQPEVEEIHNKVTRAYLRFLEKMDPDSPNYDPEYVPNPAIFGHFNKFLAMNDIKAVPVKGGKISEMQRIAKVIKMPTFERHERASGE